MVYTVLPVMFLAINPMLNDSATIFRAFLLSTLPPLYFVFYKNNFNRYKKEFIALLLIITLYLMCWIVFQNQSYADFLFGAYGRGFGILPLAGLYLSIFISADRFLKESSYFFKFTYTTLVISIVYGLFQSNGLDLFEYSNKSSGIRLTLGNANFASALLGILSVIPLAYFYVDRSKKRFIHLFILFLTLITIFQSDSSQGFIFWVINFVLFILFKSLENNRITIRKLSYITVGLTSFLLFVFILFQDKPVIKSFVSYLNTNLQITGRYEHWLVGIRIWQNHQLYGVGIDNLNRYSGQYMSDQWSASLGGFVVPDKSHNTLIDHFANGGIVVGLLWLIFITLVTWYCIKIQTFNIESIEHWKINAVGCMWITYLLQTFISTDHLMLSFIGYLSAGGIMAIYREGIKQKSEKYL